MQAKPEYVKKIIRLWIKQAKKTVSDRNQERWMNLAKTNVRKQAPKMVRRQKTKDSF